VLTEHTNDGGGSSSSSSSSSDVCDDNHKASCSVYTHLAVSECVRVFKKSAICRKVVLIKKKSKTA
jgi:hypothetical protein